MTKRVVILISGSGSNMVRLVEDMAGDHPARPVLVLSNVRDAVGLGKAAALGVPTAVVDHRDYAGDRAAFEAALRHRIAVEKPDIVCLAGFMRILGSDFVKHYQGSILNIHPSLLPKYRGLDTHARALSAGETEHGATVHLVTPALDDGPVLGQARVPVLPADTPDGLAARVLAAEHRLYPAVLRRFASGDPRPVQLP